MMYPSHDNFLDTHPVISAQKNYKAAETKMLLTNYSMSTTPAQINTSTNINSSPPHNNRHSYLFWRRGSHASSKTTRTSRTSISDHHNSDIHDRLRRSSKTSTTSQSSSSTRSWRRPSTDEDFLNARPITAKIERSGVVLMQVSVEEEGDEDVSGGRIGVVKSFEVTQDGSGDESGGIGLAVSEGLIEGDSEDSDFGCLDDMVESEPVIYDDVVQADLRFLFGEHSDELRDLSKECDRRFGIGEWAVAGF